MSETKIEDRVVLLTEPSPRDDRDWIAESIYSSETKCPKTLDLRPELQDIRNQGSQGSCLAQSAACMKEWQEKQDIEFDGYMSPQFIYNLRSNSGSGMHGRDAMKILYKNGVCHESDYKYGEIQTKEEVIANNEIVAKALNHKIKSFARVHTIDATKKALFQNGPCIICFPVYNHGVEMWRQENKDQKMKGGHAMTLVGYTKKAFIIRNSWGSNWGDDGYCYYPFKQWGSHWEIWTTIDDESVKPKKPKFKWCW